MDLSPKQLSRLDKAAIASRKLKQERIVRYEKNPKVCNFCGKSLDYKQRNNKFCSHTCSAKKNNQVGQM